MLLPAIADLPATEADRLESLHHYQIVHSFQEEVFNEFVALAARIFSLPISLLNLVDAQQVLSKAQYGVPRLPPKPRAEMLCSVVVEQNQLLVYHDLSTTLPMASDMLAIQATLATGARFYAAAPVRMPGQHSIGALCLLDRRPREFSQEEQDVLQQLADLVSQAIVVRHVCHSSAALGEARWWELRTQVRDEVHALGALVRYLLARYGMTIPVPEEVLHLVVRRLHDLRLILHSVE
jgi:transcriptional regulator with GAF, ATPase, and Fis domain